MLLLSSDSPEVITLTPDAFTARQLKPGHQDTTTGPGQNKKTSPDDGESHSAHLARGRHLIHIILQNPHGGHRAGMATLLFPEKWQRLGGHEEAWGAMPVFKPLLPGFPNATPRQLWRM